MLHQLNFLLSKSWPFVFPSGMFLVVGKQPTSQLDLWNSHPISVYSWAELTWQILLRVSLLLSRRFHSTSYIFCFTNFPLGLWLSSQMWLTSMAPNQISQMVTIIFTEVDVIGWPGQDNQCFNAILPNHPTLSLTHRVQKTVLYISVSFAVSYTGLLLPSF